MYPNAEFRERVEAAFIGGTFNGDFNFNLRKLITTRRLNPEDVDRMRAIYVPCGDTLSRAIAAARERGAVILCAEPGNGRRITAVNIAVDLGMTPEWLVIDEEDVYASLHGKGHKTYLLNLQESAPEVIPTVGKELANYIARLREVGSYLVVLATERELRTLDLAVEPEIVKLSASNAREVFLAHLAQWRSREESQVWAADDRISGVLTGASSQDAVTLAEHVRESGHRTPQEGAQEVLAAYCNWEKELDSWFAKTKGPEQGYQRALLLSVATMEGSSVAEVFDAADMLCKAVGIPYPPGRGLIGPGVSDHLQDVDARYVKGRVEFTRPRYGVAVLDHVWEDRPYFQSHLTTWLTKLREDQPTAILLRLAMRHGLTDLVLETVQGWSGTDPKRAVDMLTAAAMSDELGRAVRSRMYVWAREGNQESLHLVVAAVCGGPMADVFDRIALTRLKHLAGRDSERVKDAVLTALAGLVTRPQLRVPTVTEIVKWTGTAGQVQRTGLRAFVKLAALRSGEGRLVLMPHSTREETLIGDLASGWRASLRDPASSHEAKTAAVAWLEEVAQGVADGEVICQVLAKACRSSIDVGVLAPLIWHWARTAPEDGVDRESLCIELMRRIGEADRLTSGISLLDAYDVEETTEWDS
ncbi:hypothetical protein OHA77_28430 [Streptosporangium sp. NBC_01639]|uniref:hypothetical protein n=1 Tax=Streptosporangium sp. NBC_01639 TaxID=2975948 RepID=UPI0038669D34|nr:hypothetical protein OHA77_28430 [Streptosporangium sp. NBC_01639]